MKEKLNYQFLNKLKILPFIQEIWLFGSRARGDHRERSDIDLAIICPDATDSDWAIVGDIIEDADTLLKVDYIRFEKNMISNNLYDNILKDKMVIYVKKSN